jgi:hypothetical protein
MVAYRARVDGRMQLRARAMRGRRAMTAGHGATVCSSRGSSTAFLRCSFPRFTKCALASGNWVGTLPEEFRLVISKVP